MIYKQLFEAMEMTFIDDKLRIANSLISHFDINYNKRHNINIVSGDRIINKFFSKNHKGSLFIVDSTGLKNIMEFYKDIILPDDCKIIDIESIKSGQDIERIINITDKTKSLIGIGGGRTQIF